MTRTSRLTLGLALLALATSGCQRDWRFESHSTYRAPRSGLILEGDATGLVPAGQDLGRDYEARFVLFSEADPERRVEITRSSERADECRVAGRSGSLPWTFRSAAGSLAEALQESGIAQPEPDELAGLVEAMDGLVSGPKGTLLDGQTRVLEVVDVALDYPLY